MKEKYFEDLGLDDGEEIFKKFKINVDEILNKKEKDEESTEDDNKESKKWKLIIQNKRGGNIGNSSTKK